MERWNLNVQCSFPESETGHSKALSLDGKFDPDNILEKKIIWYTKPFSHTDRVAQVAVWFDYTRISLQKVTPSFLLQTLFKISERMDESETSLPTDTIDPFVLYARSLHDYTLRLWTETRRIAEERLRAQQLEASMPSSPPREDQTKKRQFDQSSSSKPDHSSDVQT